MEENVIRIPKKGGGRGDDGHKTFSIRIREELVCALDDLATQSNRSRNELISMILEYGVSHCEIVE